MPALEAISQIAFLPWLKLKSPVLFDDVRFVPVHPLENQVDELLKDLAPALTRILKSYVDLEDQSVDHCTLVCIADREPTWNLGSEEHDRVAFAVAVLCLAALAKNNYFGSVGCYSNAAQFKIYWQQFRAPVEGLALRTRRRVGSTLAGGYERGKVKFSIPAQCPPSEQPMCIDESLISAIDAALKAGSRSCCTPRPCIPPCPGEGD